MRGFKITVNKPATAPDNKVFIITLGDEFYFGAYNEYVLPPLKKSQATQRIMVPKAMKV